MDVSHTLDMDIYEQIPATSAQSPDCIQSIFLIFFSYLGCPIENSTSSFWFKEVADKCYYIETNGHTFQEAQIKCSSVFGSDIDGIPFEPTTSVINDAVLQTAVDTTGCTCWYWIGVKNGDLTYQSNGNPVSLASVPWDSGEPTSSGDCVSAYSGPKKWQTKACDTSNGYVICEMTSSGKLHKNQNQGGE